LSRSSVDADAPRRAPASPEKLCVYRDLATLLLLGGNRGPQGDGHALHQVFHESAGVSPGVVAGFGDVQYVSRCSVPENGIPLAVKISRIRRGGRGIIERPVYKGLRGYRLILRAAAVRSGYDHGILGEQTTNMIGYSRRLGGWVIYRSGFLV